MILVIDNYDSFTYNLVQYLGQCGAEVVVRRNDEITLEEIQGLHPDGILLSPGPCTPDRSGVCVPLLRAALDAHPPSALQVPIFGVCLGHQAMGLVGGGLVGLASRVRHGKTSPVRHDGKGVFAGMPNPFQAVRYHSLSISRDSLPDGFDVAATAEDDGEIMGIRHRSRPIEGVQFHPESVLTEQGMRLVQNFASSVERASSNPLP